MIELLNHCSSEGLCFIDHYQELWSGYIFVSNPSYSYHTTDENPRWSSTILFSVLSEV